MKLYTISAITLLFLTGCSSFSDQETSEVASSNSTVGNDAVYQFPESPQELLSNEDLFNNKPLNHDINFYMRGLMQNLTTNIQQVNSETPLAVTSFIYLDGDENHASLLGNQISESLIHEIHKVGIPVLDFKVTDYLRVTENGDFIMTRDFNQLTARLPVEYVVTGNLVKHQGGYLVNARIVGIKSKVVVATAQSFIPTAVANAVLDSGSIPEPAQVGLISG